ncbi:MAG: hypothetical protein EG822_12625 [Deltaproteobacteria bacterium]|nr:hypothetical protein [Deltaproteobacteria bacterium]TLN03812.1 MAG: replication endonuclease [bacterium]
MITSFVCRPGDASKYPLLPFTSQPTGGENICLPSVAPSGSWGASLCRDKSGPIGFITCPEPPTSNLIRSEQSAFFSWQRRKYQDRKIEAARSFLDVCHDCTLSCERCTMTKELLLGLPKHGYKVSLYPSGELTGAQFSRNVQSRPPKTSGSSLSVRFTPSARQKIRRAVENSPYNLSVFMTLTFAPSKLRGFLGCNELNDYQTFRYPPVSQAYGKKQLVRFLDALSKRQKRTVESRGTGELLQYIWTAELQKNGNIHFHILLNTRFPIKWLSERWGQASNSVDVRSLKNAEHAARYISKYVSKDENSVIEGRRYYISEGLRESMKPTVMVYEGQEMKKELQDIIEAMKEEIEKEGGHVIDFGFHLPKPRRSRPYKDKNGKKKFTRSTSSRIQRPILNVFDEHYSASIAPF